MRNTTKANYSRYERCLKCSMPLLQVKSRETGFCMHCRSQMVIGCIPEAQHKRYLERIGAYEKYKEKID